MVVITKQYNMKLIRRKKWKPVMYFYHSFKMYLLMARKTKTGFIKFRASQLNKKTLTQMRDERLLKMYDPTEQLKNL